MQQDWTYYLAFAAAAAALALFYRSRRGGRHLPVIGAICVVVLLLLAIAYVN